MLGGQDPVIRGLQTSDDGRGEDLPGEATVTGTMYRVHEGPSEGITGYPTPNL